MTKISIIVPFHNVEKYISKCLTSLIYQSLEDIEIICINDASTDDSKNIVQHYVENDTRIILLNVDNVSGQSYARNIGINVASGEYIGFVDSDDWVELDMFEKMYNKAKSVDSDITMCQAQLYDDKEQTLYTNDYYNLKSLEKYGDKVFTPEETKDEILNINVVLWNKIYKREFLQNISAKFQDGYIYEDLPFFFETYLKAQRINILWEASYYYRQNRQFSTMQNSDKKVYDRIPMVERTYNVLKQAPFFEEKKAEIISWIIDDIFHRYTLLEDKYYEDYFGKMKEFFQRIELTPEDEQELAKSYCYDEFKNILERSYYGFWNFLVEKYKTSNKRIKAAEHKCNLDIIAIKEYLEQYKKEANDEKKRIVEWWQKHCEEVVKKKTDEQFIYLEAKKSEELKAAYEEWHSKLVKQEYELKAWQAESVKQVSEKLKADYEWKLEEQKQHYQEALIKQKEYYENNYLLVKIILKFYKKVEQLKNKIRRIIKKN
ncbi:TPA: glycosyltransferase [Candidatus Avigastranaerophilus faecigallinarum]|nr:glycosyltransferase [Candidatus Avigastranaerophilus faecigallinarum]